MTQPAVLISEVEMYARVVLGVGKGVLFREVSSVQAWIVHVNGLATVQECPHREVKIVIFSIATSSSAETSRIARPVSPGLKSTHAVVSGMTSSHFQWASITHYIIIY